MCFTSNIKRIIASGLVIAASALAVTTDKSSGGTASSCTPPNIVSSKMDRPEGGKNPYPVLNFLAGSKNYTLEVLYNSTPAAATFRSLTKFLEPTPPGYTEALLTIGSHTFYTGESYRVELIVRNECGRDSRTLNGVVPAKTASWLGYVALGDSYSSGEGNPPFSKGNCHLSVLGWPYIVGADYPNGRVEITHDLACSGARTDALFSPLYGQAAQLKQLRDWQANIVTITIGGNDVGFSSVLRNCFLHDCVKNGRIARAEEDISKLRSRLTYVFGQLKKAAPEAKVFVVGYPRIFPNSQSQTSNCGWLEPQERVDLNDSAKLLDAVEKLAARAADVNFISVINALNGHELCTSNSWLVPVASKTNLLGQPVSSDGHPTPLGQEAIAEVVLKHIV